MAIVVRDRTIAILLLILALLTVVEATYFSVKTSEQAKCLTQYSVDTNRAIQARTDIADRRNTLLVGLIDTLVNHPPKSREARIKLTQDYLAKSRRLDSERNKKPLPIVPRCDS